MSYELVSPTIQSGKTISLTKRGVRFSDKFIFEENLKEYKHVEIRVDESLRRVGFKFFKEPTGKSVKLAKVGRGEGKVSHLNDLKKFKWLKEIMEKRDVSDRRFLVEEDRKIRNPEDGTKYFIFVGYKFEEKRPFNRRGDYPRLPGVYVLYKESEIVRIGEAEQIETRLKEHFREYTDKIDEYQYAEIPDIGARKLEEKRLLQEHKDAYGKLPRYNLANH